MGDFPGVNISIDEIMPHQYVIDMKKYYEKDDEDKKFIRELIRKLFKYSDESFSSTNMPNTMAISKYMFVLESLKSDGLITNKRGKKLQDLLDENKKEI